MEKIRLGLASPGTWGSNIIKASKNSKYVEIVACSSRRMETAKKAAAEFGIKAVETYEDLLAEDIQGVIIASPHSEHLGQTLLAAEQGKHVFIEKPIANTSKEANEMIQFCEKSGVALSIGHSQRRLPGPRTLKRLFDSGEYGNPVNAVAYVGLEGIDMYGLGHWLLNAATNPGGSLYMMGVHFVETFQYLIGPIKRVGGMVQRDLKGTTIPEVAGGIFEFEKPCLGYLGSHYIAPYNSTATFYCEKAIFHMEKFGRELWIQDSPFPTIERRLFPMDDTPYGDPVLEELEEFGLCIREGKQPETGPKEALLALAAVQGLMVSAKEGRMISLEEIIKNY